MLFYVSLAIACVIVASVSVWLLRSLMAIGRSAYLNFLPGGDGKRREARYARLNAGLSEARAPWGWGRSSYTRNATVGNDPNLPKQAQVPWGWPGNAGVQRSNGEWIRRGLDSSATLASLQGMLSPGKRQSSGREPADRREGKQSDRRGRKARHVAATGNAKPWGW